MPRPLLNITYSGDKPAANLHFGAVFPTYTLARQDQILDRDIPMHVCYAAGAAEVAAAVKHVSSKHQLNL